MNRFKIEAAVYPADETVIGREYVSIVKTNVTAASQVEARRKVLELAWHNRYWVHQFVDIQVCKGSY